MKGASVVFVYSAGRTRTIAPITEHCLDAVLFFRGDAAGNSRLSRPGCSAEHVRGCCKSRPTKGGRRMNDSAGFGQVIEDIYAAALDPSHWFAATERLASYLGAPSGIAILSGGERAAVLGHTANTDAGARDAYTQRYYRLDPWAAGYMRIGGRRSFLGEELADPRIVMESEFYRDHTRHHGIFHCLGAALPVASHAAMVLAVHRPFNAAPFAAADKLRLDRLLPHLERAGRVQRALATAELQRSVALETLDRLSLGVILLTTGGVVTFANVAAERHLCVGDALMAACGRLATRDPVAAPSLRQAIAAATTISQGRGADPSTIVQAPRRERRPLSLLVAPLAAIRPAGLFAEAAVIVFIADPEQQPRLPLATLARLYCLTPAEARLMQALVAGERIEDYADRAGIRLTTVKTQLRHLFDKTDTSRQSELIALALRNLVARMANDRA
jgi:DNA-binding CsgD family transcriptional regulator